MLFRLACFFTSVSTTRGQGIIRVVDVVAIFFYLGTGSKYTNESCRSNRETQSPGPTYSSIVVLCILDIVCACVRACASAVNQFLFVIFSFFFQSMIAVLCCGSCFDEKALVEDSPRNIYTFLDGLLNSKETKVGRKKLVNLLPSYYVPYLRDN